jgi:hypothetical protein
VPAEFERIVSRAMAKSPAARFQTARELGAALLPYASQRARLNYEHEFGGVPEVAAPRVPVTTQPGVTPVPPWPAAGTFEATAQSPGSKSRRVWPALSAAVVAAGAAAAVIVLYLRASPAPPEPPLSPAPSGEMRPLAPQPSAAPGPVIAPALAATIEIVPEEAVVKLDGRVVQGRPVTVELTGAEHVLEVEAEGYAPKRATFADDPPSRIALEKAPDKPVKTAQVARPGGKKPAGSADPTVATAPQVKPAAADTPKPQKGANDAIILR